MYKVIYTSRLERDLNLHAKEGWEFKTIIDSTYYRKGGSMDVLLEKEVEVVDTDESTEEVIDQKREL